MNDPEFQQMHELSWRPKRTPAEEAALQAWLAAHPEARVEWDTEAGLSRLLERLPEAPPVASNFTALVLQAVERESAATGRTRRSAGRFWLRWLPRAAVAIILVGGFYHVHEANTRKAIAQSVAQVSRVAVVSNADVMENYDAIRRMSDPQPTPDTELLAILK